jgi:hypothetical protein
MDNATRWRRVKGDWHALPRNTLPLAFNHLKGVLSVKRMVGQYRDGHREVRIANVTCF